MSVKKKSYLVNFYNKKFKINEDICILSARAYYKDNHVVINTGWLSINVEQVNNDN